VIIFEIFRCGNLELFHPQLHFIGASLPGGAGYQGTGILCTVSCGTCGDWRGIVYTIARFYSKLVHYMYGLKHVTCITVRTVTPTPSTEHRALHERHTLYTCLSKVLGSQRIKHKSKRMESSQLGSLQSHSKRPCVCTCIAASTYMGVPRAGCAACAATRRWHGWSWRWWRAVVA
jgi:hypothetical protein